MNQQTKKLAQDVVHYAVALRATGQNDSADAIIAALHSALDQLPDAPARGTRERGALFDGIINQ